MDGEDDESDKGREDEENSDDAQAEVDRKVAQMLQNQQQYLHMCSSSAHILQLLSRLVPGMAMSGQVMDLESVTEDSEDATSRSNSASSSHSPATSDDNTGCVLWAEPIMTCQLMPSWKPFCGDVRRLPPGVKPDDLKCQHTPTCRGSCNSSYCSAAAAAAAARNRSQCPANRREGATLLSNMNPGSTSKDTNAHTSSKEAVSNPSVMQMSRKEGQKMESSGSTTIRRARASGDTTSKVPSAADAIRRTKSILAAVTSGRQANNNNNPEKGARGKGSSQESVTTRSDKRNSENDISGTTGDDRTTSGYNADDNTYSAGASKNQICDVPSNIHGGTAPGTHFPAPILVKAAGVQTDSVHVRFEETGDSTDTMNDLATTSLAGNPNNSGSSSNVYEICDQMSQTEECSTLAPTVRKSGVPARNVNTDRILWGSFPAQTEAKTSRSVRRSRTNGQLYRYPANSSAVQQRNRTQQSVSLGHAQTNKRILPPPVNLSVGTQSAREQLELDFNCFNVAPNTHRPTRKHTITLAHLKDALKIVKFNLQRLNSWTVRENSLVKEASPQTRSTVSTFTITEIESLNIPADHAEKDSLTTETVEPMLSDMIYDGTDVVDINAGGDADKSVADNSTEVESIFYVEHHSPKELGSDLEVCADSLRMVYNDGKEKTCDRNQTNSSCPRKDVLACSRCSSGVFPNEEDRPMSNKYYDHASPNRFCQQKQLLNNYHGESPDSTRMETEVSAINHSRDLRITEEFNQHEKMVAENSDETPIRHSQSNTIKRKEEVTSDSLCPVLRLKLPRARSAENSVSDAQNTRRTQPCRPYSAGEMKTLEGDNNLDNVLVVKARDDFPPHFPEAGDTVVNIPVVDNVKRDPGSTPFGAVRNGKQEQDTPNWNQTQRNELGFIKATESIRTKLLRKRNLQKTAKRLIFIQNGKSNNASLGKDNTCFKATSEDDEFCDSTLVQSDKHESHPIANGDSIDSAAESKIDHEKLTQLAYLGDGSDNNSLKVSEKEPSIEDDDMRTNLHSSVYEDNSQDTISSISSHCDSVISLPRGTKVSKQSKDDVYTTEASANITAVATETPGITSDTFARSHLRTRSRASKAGHAKDVNSQKDNKLTGKVTHGDAIVSGSNCVQYLDMLPGFMPTENCHTCTKLPGTCMKNILILPEPRDLLLTAVQCNSKTAFSKMLDEELELAEAQGKRQVRSAMAEKGSPGSSKSSSIRAPSVTLDAALAPAPMDSTGVNTSSAAPLVNEEPPRIANGLKTRLRRFFSQCLHPFSHRN